MLPIHAALANMIQRSVKDEERETETKARAAAERLESSWESSLIDDPASPTCPSTPRNPSFTTTRRSPRGPTLSATSSRARARRNPSSSSTISSRARWRKNLRDDLQRQPTDCWTSRAEDDDDDVAHDFSLCAHARAVSLFTRAACVMARGSRAGAYPSFSRRAVRGGRRDRSARRRRGRAHRGWRWER